VPLIAPSRRSTNARYSSSSISVEEELVEEADDSKTSLASTGDICCCIGDTTILLSDNVSMVHNSIQVLNYELNATFNGMERKKKKRKYEKTPLKRIHSIKKVTRFSTILGNNNYKR
jgi:hypothetical protein